jgi:hypothetical protein
MEQLRKTYAGKGTMATPEILWKDYLHTVFNLKSFIFLS